MISLEATEFNEDIDWLINEAGGKLGVKGIDYRSMGGDKNAVIVNTRPYHDRLERKFDDVARERRLSRFWVRLTRSQQRVLAGRYERKQAPFGFEVVFRELKGVAVVMSGDQLEQVKGWTSRIKKHEAELGKLLKETFMANRDAHDAWRAAQRAEAKDWANQA